MSEREKKHYCDFWPRVVDWSRHQIRKATFGEAKRYMRGLQAMEAKQRPKK